MGMKVELGKLLATAEDNDVDALTLLDWAAARPTNADRRRSIIIAMFMTGTLEKIERTKNAMLAVASETTGNQTAMT